MTLVSQPTPLNTIVIPAPSTLVARLLVASAVKVETWVMRRRTRKHLRELPDHLLQDIGLTYVQKDMECRKMFWKP